MLLLLQQKGVLAALRRAGVQWLDVCALEDNLALRPLDPLLVGAAAARNCECGAKVLQRSDPTPASLLRAAASRAASRAFTEAYLSPLLPLAGQYVFSCEYVRKIMGLLEVDPLAGYRLSPVPISGRREVTSANKPDRLLSDWLLLAPAPCYLLVREEAEVALAWGCPPLLKTPGPKAACDQLLTLHTSWVESAGGRMVADDLAIEVSPLVSYAGEGLQRWCEGTTFNTSYDLELQGFGVPPVGRGNVPGWALPLSVVALVAGALAQLGKKSA